MTPDDKLQSLMAEIGPVLELAEVVAFPDQGLWTLAFDDGTVVEVEEDAHGRVLFSVDVSDSVADDALRMLLQFNLLWRQTGGLRFALAGAMAVLMVELPVEELHVALLSSLLTDLHSQASHWRGVLEAAPQAGSADSAFPGGAMRV